MIGAVGAGKSSFMNTVTSVFKGRICNKAASGSVMNSLTTMVSNVTKKLIRMEQRTFRQF